MGKLNQLKSIIVVMIFLFAIINFSFGQNKNENKGRIQNLGKVNMKELQEQEKQMPDSLKKKKIETGPEENRESIKPKPIPNNAIIKKSDIKPGQLKRDTSQQKNINKKNPPQSGIKPEFPGGIGGGAFGNLRPPDMGGAVSSNFIVETINTQIIVFDKTGASLTTVTLAGFFASIGTVPDVFDPHILFDTFNNRWIITAAVNRNIPSAGIVIAVSDNADPTSTWNKFFLDADATDHAWFDFPMLGLNKNWIVVGGNLYSRQSGITAATNAANCQITSNGHGLSTGNSVTITGVTGMTQLNGNSYTITVVDGNHFLLNTNSTAFGVFTDNLNDKWFMPITDNAITYVLDKMAIYGGAAAAPTIFHPAAQCSYPAWVCDNTTNNLHLVANWNGNSGGNGFLGVYTISGTASAPTLSAVQFISVASTWAGGGPGGPQQGSAVLLATNDDRMEQVVMRNNSLWFAHTVFLPAAAPTHSAVQWWQVDVAGAIPTLAVQQLGRIEDPTAATFYAFPSIDVNAANDVAIGFSRFSSTEFGGGNYAYHFHTDAAGTMNPDVLFKAGLAKYDGQRWGDYSSTITDPDLFSFWTLQEYAETPVAGNDRWGTEWSHITLPIADLYSKDRPEDAGAEPNPSTLAMWQSEDIWLRKLQDDALHSHAHMHEDAEFRTGTANPNFVYVEVRNRGGVPSAGTEQLHLYWAKAGSGLSWETSWDGLHFFDSPANTELMGAPIGTVTIPAIAAGASNILEFAWNPPDPDVYIGPLAPDKNHFCLLARITTNAAAPFGMTIPETPGLYSNVQNNNNIVWKNMEVYDMLPGTMAPAYAVIGNFSKENMKAKFKFEVMNEEAIAGLLDKGTIKVTTDGKLKEILQHNGLTGDGIKETGDGNFEVMKEGAALENVMLEPNDFGTFKMEFVPANAQDLGKGFAVNFTQIDMTNGTEQIVGGQTFVFGQVKGFGTSPPGETGTASHWHWWYWLLIILLFIFIIWFIKK